MSALRGPLLESFVHGELRKLMAVAQDDCRLLYCRDHDQTEVDFVIENPAGAIVGIEVKLRPQSMPLTCVACAN